jgi:predicted protein tyrosine phosphatase
MMPFYHAATLSDSLTSSTGPILGERRPRQHSPPAPAEADPNVRPQLTPTAGRLRLQKLRPQVSASFDLARARGKASSTNVPSRFPCMLCPLYVGSGAHAADLALLRRLRIRAVVNCAPAVCRAPKEKYAQHDIAYLEIDAHDDRDFPLLTRCLETTTSFISRMHAEERPVLVHCMAGVNRSATLVVAHLLLAQQRNLFELFAQCVAARPSILQNPNFQLQLCALAHRNGLLYEPDEAAISRALLSEPLAPPASPSARPTPPMLEEVACAPDFGIVGDEEPRETPGALSWPPVGAEAGGGAGATAPAPADVAQEAAPAEAGTEARAVAGETSPGGPVGAARDGVQGAAVVDLTGWL